MTYIPGSGGGGGSISASNDVALNNPVDTQVLSYDATLQKWTNADKSGGSVDTSKMEATIFHDGTTGGGTRPTGYARVKWVNPVGTVYGRPANMQAGDIWEHDQV